MISLARSNGDTTFLTLVRSAGAAALFAIPFAMLLVWPRAFNPFLTGKTVIFRDLAGFALLCGAILFAVSQASFSTLVKMFAIFAISLGIADAFATYPVTALWGEPTRQEGLIAVVALLAYLACLPLLIDSERLWRCLIGTWATVGTVIAASGLVQLFGHSADRVTGLIGNAVFLGCMTALCGIFALWSASLATSTWERRLWISSAAIQFAAVFATSTRSAALGLMVGAVLALWKTRWRWPLLAVSGVSIGAILWRHGEFSTSLLYRVNCWGHGISLAASHPWLGWGQDNMQMVCMPELWDRAHNVLIQTFSEGGIPALLSYSAFLVVAFVTALRRHAGFALAAVSAYVVMVMFEPDPLTTSLPFLTATGWLASRET